MEPQQDASATPPQAVGPDSVWIDLYGPDDEARALVRQLTGSDVPTLDELSEIESSSRLVLEGETLQLSLPLALPGPAGTRTVPLGFVLTRERLITVRYGDIPAWPALAKQARQAEEAGQGSAEIMTMILEAVVERIADVLEHVGGTLDRVSHHIFHSENDGPSRPARANRELRGALRTIGRTGAALAKLRDTLLGIGRMLPFLGANTRAWLPAALKPRLATLRADVASLAQHGAQLLGQIQFLQDATLGFINIEQNNIIKVLTVVSVAGVPPTLVASMYGMNFKGMPELDWAWGYPYALTLIVLSAVLPLLWFRRRGWL
jgi:magnesium transporter